MFSLHVEALAWLRFGRHMELVCTEAGMFNADVLGMSEDDVVEIEIKKSRADLLAEFRNKGAKHYLYQNCANGGTTNHVPNFFYVFIPEKLGQGALEVLVEKSPKAGLAVLCSPSKSPYGAGRNVRVLRKASRLHARKPSRSYLRAMRLRMGSELCTLRLLLEQGGAEPLAGAKILELMKSVHALAATPAWEERHEADDQDSKAG